MAVDGDVVSENTAVDRPGLSLTRRPAIRQFVKFCIVGASSTAIDYGLFALLHKVVRLSQRLDTYLVPYPDLRQFAADYHIGVLLAVACAFVISVTNGFYWNRRWTFRDARGNSARRQYVQFVLVNIVGLTLNLTIVGSTIGFFARFVQPDNAPFLSKALATVVCVFWNFTANKLWTFRR